MQSTVTDVSATVRRVDVLKGIQEIYDFAILLDFRANAVTPVAVNSNAEKITLGYEEVGER